MAVSTLAPDATKTKEPKKPVYADPASIEAYRNEAKNKSVNTNIHPALYAELVAAIAEKKGTRPASEAGINGDGRACLKASSLSETLREIIAEYSGYDGELAIISARGTGGGMVVGAVKTFQSVTMQVFTMQRALIDTLGVPEAQVKEAAFDTVKKMLSKSFEKLVVTNEQLEEIWQASGEEEEEEE